MTPLITPDAILLDLQVFYKEQAIQQLAERLVAQGPVLSLNCFLRDVTEREKYGTEIGHGVAAPHARSCYVSRISVAFARLAWPIDWNGQQTDLVFLMAVPSYADTPQQVEVLGRLFTRLSSAGVLNDLRQAKTVEEVAELLEV